MDGAVGLVRVGEAECAGVGGDEGAAVRAFGCRQGAAGEDPRVFQGADGAGDDLGLRAATQVVAGLMPADVSSYWLEVEIGHLLLGLLIYI